MTESILPDSIEAYAYLASIITSSDDAIISKDLYGNITSWNPSAERIFGYTAQEAIGKHIGMVIPHNRLKEEDFILGEVKQGKKIDHFETVRRSKSGQEINLSITVSPIRDINGNIVGASKIARDISDIKKAARSNAYLGAIIESSDDAIISKDLNGFITSWNKSAERIFGYTSNEVIGKHVTLIIPADRIDEEDKILTTLRTGEKIDHYETIRRKKDGTLVPVSLTVSPIRDPEGNIIGASKVSRDLTERVKAEEAVRDSNRKKDEFLTNMSHELRTPMNAVIGLANLLKGMDDLPEKARKFVDTLKISADNLLELINDLLDFAKIDSDNVQIESIEFDLAKQVEKAISIINVKAKEKNLTLYVNYSPELNQYFMGDPLRIHQVLMNLLSNAVKFTEKGSIEVDISGSADILDAKTILTIKVSDTGVGIPKDKLESIFDKFSQADSSITRKFGGSGLGLSITKAFVEKMGGSINVTSQQGVGSTFTVTLPVGNTNKPSSVTSFTTSAGKELEIHRKNVLLVEDYEPNILVAGSILEKLGYDYDVAKNGFEALRKFAYGQYQVILMDLQMHDLDGLEATRRIRRIEADKELQRTPIIAMTAHVREQDKDKCMEAGMDDFIPKPFEVPVLAEKIARYVRLDAETNKLASVKSKKG